jgi:hypothetical protein
VGKTLKIPTQAGFFSQKNLKKKKPFVKISQKVVFAFWRKKLMKSYENNKSFFESFRKNFRENFCKNKNFREK